MTITFSLQQENRSITFGRNVLASFSLYVFVVFVTMQGCDETEKVSTQLYASTVVKVATW